MSTSCVTCNESAHSSVKISFVQIPIFSTGAVSSVIPNTEPASEGYTRDGTRILDSTKVPSFVKIGERTRDCASGSDNQKRLGMPAIRQFQSQVTGSPDGQGIERSVFRITRTPQSISRVVLAGVAIEAGEIVIGEILNGQGGSGVGCRSFSYFRCVTIDRGGSWPGEEMNTEERG